MDFSTADEKCRRRSFKNLDRHELDRKMNVVRNSHVRLFRRASFGNYGSNAPRATFPPATAWLKISAFVFYEAKSLKISLLGFFSLS